MDRFDGLDKAKQLNIINAALTCFGQNGYKKTSIQDIANQASLSKALLFHYFKSKKGLYLYVLKYATSLSGSTILHHLDPSEHDLFVVLKQIQHAKFDMVERYPDLFRFLESAHFERDPEIEPDIQVLQHNQINDQLTTLFEHIDTTRFRPGVSLETAMNLITWVTQGFVESIKGQHPLLTSDTAHDYDVYLDLLKKAILKED